MTDHKCPDCDSAMEKGFLPDHGHAAVHRPTWHRGDAEPLLSFGFIKSGIKYDKNETIPVIAYRCTNCGLLRSYARVNDEE